MQGELGPASIRTGANHKGTRTAGAHSGSELISSVSLPPVWQNRCLSLTFSWLSLCLCVCVSTQVPVMCEQCLPLPLVQVPQLVYPWPLQLFLPGGTSQRLWGWWNTHTHATKTNTCTRVSALAQTRLFPLSFPLCLSSSLLHAPPPRPTSLCFPHPASCSVFQRCVSLGACLQKDSHLSSSIYELALLTQSSCFFAVEINTLLSEALLSLARLNNDGGSLWPSQSCTVVTNRSESACVYAAFSQAVCTWIAAAVCVFLYFSKPIYFYHSIIKSVNCPFWCKAVHWAPLARPQRVVFHTNAASSL